MKNERDTLIQLTPSQQDPGLAKASDFVIEDRGPGQNGDTPAQRARLLREGNARFNAPLPERNDVNSQGSPHTALGASE